MSRAARFLALLALFGTACGAVAGQQKETSFGRFGDLPLYVPDGKAARVVLLVSGAGGWLDAETAAARALAAEGALVVGVPLPQYLGLLPDPDDLCDYPADDFDALSHHVQKEEGFEQYQQPVIAGLGDGAAWAYAVLAQAPPDTFRGAAGVGFCPEIHYERSLCRGSGLRTSAAGRGVQRLDPDDGLASPWAVAPPSAGGPCGTKALAAFVGDVPGAMPLPPPQGQQGAAAGAAATLRDAVAKVLAAPVRARAAAAGDVADLPLVEARAAIGPPDLLAVLVTGDGGWAGIDKDLARYLVDHGIPVVGIDSLRYFWGKKTPAVVAADLTRVLRHYLERWGEERVLLIGYSLGAEGALFMATGLPADLRSRLARVVLLGPATHTDLEVHVGDWLGLGEAGGYPLRPEAAKLPADRILCVYGSEDRDASLCPTLKGAAVVEIPGGHHFNHDYERLGRVILDGLR